MDASEQFAFPTPQPDDSEEVRAAIERASQLWSEDPKESLRWLRQAAEAASDAGDDLRSVQLARTGADLRNLANISASAPPPATLPPRTVESAGPDETTAEGAPSSRDGGQLDGDEDPGAERVSASDDAGRASVSPLDGDRISAFGAVQAREERHTEPGTPGMPGAGFDPTAGINEAPAGDINAEGSASTPELSATEQDSGEPITTTSAPRFDEVDDEGDGQVVSVADLQSSPSVHDVGDARTAETETTPNAPPVSPASSTGPGTGPYANPYAANPYATAPSNSTSGGNTGGAERGPGSSPTGGARAVYSAGTSGIPGPLGVSPAGVSARPDSFATDPSNGPTAAQVAAMVPRTGLGKDPAQTVPATPAASAAAAALASGAPSHQPMSPGYGPPPGSFRGGLPGAGQPAAGHPGPVPSNSGANGNPQNASPNSGVGRLGPNFGGARRPAAALMGNGPGNYNAAPRAEQQTLIGRPQASRGVHDQTPAATPAAIQAESSPPPSLNSRFVQHRAIAVAISTNPNSAGHFDLHPLAEGEKVEPGFRAALLVGLTPGERIFPGRE